MTDRHVKRLQHAFLFIYVNIHDYFEVTMYFHAHESDSRKKQNLQIYIYMKRKITIFENLITKNELLSTFYGFFHTYFQAPCTFTHVHMYGYTGFSQVIHSADI